MIESNGKTYKANPSRGNMIVKYFLDRSLLTINGSIDHRKIDHENPCYIHCRNTNGKAIH